MDTSPEAFIAPTAATNVRQTRNQKRSARQRSVEAARTTWRQRSARLVVDAAPPERWYREVIAHWRGLYGETDWALWRRACVHAGCPFDKAAALAMATARAKTATALVSI